MNYSSSNANANAIANNNNTEAPSSACCTNSSSATVALAELKLVDWDSLRMRSSSSSSSPPDHNDNNIVELGLKKELREMLPIIVYKESFFVNDTLCSVCLGDYQADDQLQQIPACGHTFHMECIDSWLVNHTTCPLCRLSLLASSAKTTQNEPHNVLPETNLVPYSGDNDNETSVESRLPQGNERC
ncbi:hypothetical protein ACFE04_025986 [Oxalis oulophora]